MGHRENVNTRALMVVNTIQTIWGASSTPLSALKSVKIKHKA